MAENLAVYQLVPRTQISPDAAAAFLHGWLNTALRAPLALPAFCPQCHAIAAAVTVGRGEPPWIRVEPCACLIEIPRGI